jgi:hypothetical protein
MAVAEVILLQGVGGGQVVGEEGAVEGGHTKAPGGGGAVVRVGSQVRE